MSLTREERLAATLHLVLHDAHRMYGSTATHHGGIGGRAITMGCAFKDPAADQEWCQYDIPSGPLRDFLTANPGFDLTAAAEEMRQEFEAVLRGEEPDAL